MDFDNPKVYGDTFISDGLVYSSQCNLQIGILVRLLCIWKFSLSFRSEEMYSGNSLAPDKGNRGFIHWDVSFIGLTLNNGKSITN